MYFDFSGLLFMLALVTGMVALLEWLVFSKKRPKGKKHNKFIEICVGFFPVFLIVFMIRTFLFEPYRIPSGSMKPTLVEGDFILVNKLAYGWYFPYIDKRLTLGQDIERGDVIVFRYPPDPEMNFIKRVIGLPGDKIIYNNHELYINGERIPKEYVETTYTDTEMDRTVMVRTFKENLPPEHEIYDQNHLGLAFEGVVPEGHYFAMGDNRDDSGDSRVWGYVPDSLVKGKASYILLSIDGDKMLPRLKRTGVSID